ncbi:MAG: helicase-exonuclease AddAB subunit AddA [Defluviitaleaceae bacterium]|nr:helicase-exonuclease AddAB subunit AddA [Defluviitaleaceae bacterium]
MNSFTTKQQEAIDSNARNILVSAAAGSGKTAVLTERILRHVRQGVDITSLLVVTFTKAAVAEMQERITDKLQEFDPRQAALLPTADISTIHSFCTKLVRENFQLLDIDPAFRIGDEAELSLLRTRVMDELFEAEYEGENSEAFCDLVDVYGGKSTDGRLDELVRKIYNFIESDPFPLRKADEYAAFFCMEGDIDGSIWFSVVKDELSTGLDGIIEGLKQAIEICGLPGGPIKYEETLDMELADLEDLQDVVESGAGFQELYNAFLGFSFADRIPSITAKDDVDPDLKTRTQDLRNNVVKKKFTGLVEGIFFAPPGKMEADINALAPRVKALMGLASRFAVAYYEEKRARNVLDFSDLEHLAIQVLYPGGQLNPDIERYYEVLIDEYQDSNLIQDMILSAVAQRRFMVGDMKQGIYRFRRANPKLFRDKYMEYSLPSNDNVCIDLSNNFRSRPEVLDAVNFFFSQLMCQEVGEVEYDKNAALYPGRSEYPPLETTPAMWVEILDQKQDTPDEAEDDDETPDNIVAETRMIAATIKKLLANRKVYDGGQLRSCQPGDIAILVRGLRSKAGTMIEELKNHNIDAIAEMNSGFFDQLEIRTALALLRITDNPRQDIDLITVLHSPVYGLTPDDLLEIRCFDGGLPGDAQFFDRIKAYALGGSILGLRQRLEGFLAQLGGWHKASVHLPVSRLMGLIYDQTLYPAHVLSMPGGLVRQANLRLLLEKAIEFEATSLKTLFHFISYIEKLDEAGENFSTAVEPVADSANRVKIMTIHKSKGLEFPIVICAFLGGKFNTDSTCQPVILHPDMGIGPYYVDSKLRTRANTIARYSLARLTHRESLSEELRCLYVAMTRAKDLLVLTARSRDFSAALKKYSAMQSHRQITLPAYFRRSAASYLDWIMPCLLRHRNVWEIFAGDRSTPPDEVYNHPACFEFNKWSLNDIKLLADRAVEPLGENSVGRKIRPTEIKPTPQAPGHETLTEAITTLPRGCQPPGVPSKLSISEIRRLYDVTPDSMVSSEPPPIFEPPKFMAAKAAPSAAELGTALHTITEHMDYGAFASPASYPAIEALIQNLTEKNLLSPEIATFIDRKKIAELINSPLAARIRNAKSLYREAPFVLSLGSGQFRFNGLDALVFASQPEDGLGNEADNILVHGIIDCYFEEDDGIVLVDFKSDSRPEAHSVQMAIYKKALEEATSLRVKEVLVYSFGLGRAVQLDVSGVE